MAKGARMMRALLVFGLLWAGPVLAAKKTPAMPVPAMWVVSDADTKVTLFGTVHSLPRGVDWFKPHVVGALDSADLMVMETLLPDSPASMLPMVMRLARLPAERPVLERVPEIYRGTLEREMARLKTGPMDWYKTWFIALTLSNLQSDANGMDPGLGVEAVLTERAKIRKIPIEALETAEQQLIYFDALSEADQQQLLISALEDLQGAKAEMDGMIADWMTGQTDSLGDRVNADFERSPMLKQMLVSDRNARWADWIAKAMKARPGEIFIAVGAGHMAGPGSLLDALKTQGLVVKRSMPVAKKKATRR